MTPRTRKTAAALAGALVLASGAYAIGSQSGDGAALAGGTSGASPRSAGHGAPGRPSLRDRRRALADVAQRLGVSEAKLVAALEKLRDQRKTGYDELRAAFAKSLAAELGIPEARVQSALDKRAGNRKLRRDGRRGDLRDAFADELATKLGVTKAKVRAALDDLRAGGRPDLAALATRLGVTEAKLRAALRGLRPGHGRGGPDRHGDRGERLGALARDLGVSEAKLRAALERVRDDFKTQRAEVLDEYAADLAKELGISKAKVDDVIDALGHHGRRGP